jgi:predicted PurR-regulated permease PerM
MSTDDQKSASSPRWSNSAKIVVALTVAGLGLALIFRFQNIIAPLLFAFVLAYLIHPLASFFNKRLHIPWRLISTILYLLIFIGVIALLTWGGISIFDQLQNLINYLQSIIGDLPGWLAKITAKPLVIGPWSFDLSNFKLSDLTTEFQGIISSSLGKIGSLLGSIASGVGSTLTWTVFILLISYFIMSESDGVRAKMIKLTIPKYEEDIRRMSMQLSQIWNAFLRGQLIVFLITVAWYSLLLGVLGVKYFFLLALLAGLARFVPYVGPFVAWTTYGLVALFQVNRFNLLPFPYALIVVGCALLSDMVIDNFVSPRVMSNALKIHPAAVLVMVLISASLFGFIGVLLSAPVLASVKLGFTYVTRKLMDLDPWVGMETYPAPVPLSVTLDRIRTKLRLRREKKIVDQQILKKDSQHEKKVSSNPDIEKGE